MENNDTKAFQHFKFTLPILKTRTKIVKGEDGKDIEKRYVEGVASSTDLDLHGDRMDPSAIKSMADSLKYHVIRLNAEHDTSWQSELGDISKLDVSEDSRLLIEAELNDMSKAKDLWLALTDMNKKLGLSIGGYVKEYEMVKEEFKNEESGDMEAKWVRHYKNIELDHIAVTSSPANPKTWVGAIAKSVQEDSQLLAKKMEAEEENKEEKAQEKSLDIENDLSKKDKKMRDMARTIVRAIQNLEADLLLELTYAGLHILSDNQVQLLDTLLIERSLPNMDKNVSLEAEEAKKTADTAATPDGETVETPAAPENESKEEATPEVTPKEGETTENPAEGSEAKAEEVTPAVEPVVEKPAEEKPTEEAKPEGEAEKAAPKEGDACTCEDGSKGHVTGGKCVADTAKSEGSSGEEGTEGKSEEVETETPAPAAPEAEKPAEEKPADKTEDKSVTPDATAELLKSVQDLTGKMTEILKTNETLTERIKELESQPATRKTVELEKGIGDEDTETPDTKTLKQEMEEKIAEARKSNFGNPNLFAMIQKIRAEYSKKMQGQ